MITAMRRKERQLSDSESKELLRMGIYGILSMVEQDNYGYGVPLNYVYTDNGIYFHFALEGRKLNNILSNDKVSFCVVGEAAPVPAKFTMKYKSVIVSGRIHEVEGEEKFDAMMAIVQKYSGDHLEKGKETAVKFIDKLRVFRMGTDLITGKAG